jgi:hypothetical protein
MSNISLSDYVDQYPKFRDLTSNDINLIAKFTKGLPPYSDIIFSNLSNWRLTESLTQIAHLNNNLIIKIADNYGKKNVISFTGKGKYIETINELLNYENKLYYIPEFVIQGIKLSTTNSFRIEEDRDSFDYILDVDKMLDLNNLTLRTKRKEIRNFYNKNTDIEIKILDLKSYEVQEQILNVYKRWFSLKQFRGYAGSNECEFNGLQRFILNCEKFNYYCLGVVKKKVLLGFIINEIISPDYVLSSYTKGDLKYRGLFSCLTYKSAEYARDKEIKYINYESDIGINGLRQNKLGWRPIKFLKKYKVIKI